MDQANRPNRNDDRLDVEATTCVASAITVIFGNKHNVVYTYCIVEAVAIATAKAEDYFIAVIQSIVSSL